jgi:hypothetical protein
MLAAARSNLSHFHTLTQSPFSVRQNADRFLCKDRGPQIKEKKRMHRPTKYSAKCDTPSTYFYTVYDYKSIAGLGLDPPPTTTASYFSYYYTRVLSKIGPT